MKKQAITKREEKAIIEALEMLLNKKIKLKEVELNTGLIIRFEQAEHIEVIR